VCLNFFGRGEAISGVTGSETRAPARPNVGDSRFRNRNRAMHAKDASKGRQVAWHRGRDALRRVRRSMSARLGSRIARERVPASVVACPDRFPDRAGARPYRHPSWHVQIGSRIARERVLYRRPSSHVHTGSRIARERGPYRLSLAACLTGAAYSRRLRAKRLQP
jgi:hypothetical protein